MGKDNESRRGILAGREILVQHRHDLDAEESGRQADVGAEGRELRDDEESQEFGNENGEEEEEAGSKRPRGRELLAQMSMQGLSDGRSEEEMTRGRARTSTSDQHPNKLRPHMPKKVNGMSNANDEASRESHALVFPYPGGNYGALRTSPTAGVCDGFQQSTSVSREDCYEVNVGQVGDREQLFKHATSKTDRSSAANNKIVRSSYVEYLYISALMGLAGLMAFGAFLTGADLLLISLWPEVPHWLRIMFLTVSLCTGHSFFFHGVEHIQACCKIPFRKTEAMPYELLVVTGSGFYTWALILGIFDVCYKPPAGLTKLLYTLCGEFLGAASWGFALDLYQQFFSVELTTCKIHPGWSRDHFVVDFLTKLPSSFGVVWLMDLVSEHLDMSNRLDRFSFTFIYTCFLFVNFLMVAGGLRDMIFKHLNMVPVAPVSTGAVQDGSK